MQSTSDNPFTALLNLSASEKEARGLKYTPGEIFQQPGTWQTTYRRFLDARAGIASFLKHAGISANGNSPTVFLVGAGTSDYVGRSLANLLRRSWGCEVLAIPSTDLLSSPGEFLLDRNYLWVSFSRSGDTSEGVAVLDSVLNSFPRVRHLVVTCNRRAAMVELCARSGGKALAFVLDDAVNDRGLVMTSSFTNMVVAGHCLAHFNNPAQYGEILATLVEMGTKFLPLAAEAASSLCRSPYLRASFTGSGPLHAVAKECALKLLELTAGRVLTLSESSLGLRHGPLSAIDQNALYVQFLSGDERRRSYELDLLEEVSAKGLGRTRVAVSPQALERAARGANHVLCLDAPAELADEYRVPVDVILGQMLGLFASLAAGLKPDCPSPTGVINRVVSGLKVYS